MACTDVGRSVIVLLAGSVATSSEADEGAEMATVEGEVAGGAAGG
jgi:hypothetical protein